MAPARTIFFGSGTFALPILQRLRAPLTATPGHEPAEPLVDLRAVVTAPPRPAGRRGELRPTSVAQAAEAAGLPVLTPSSLRGEDAVAALHAIAPDLVVLADYGRLIPPAVLALPRLGALNLHPSLLPRHRGAAPVPAAILAGDAETGVTLMRMDAGLDTGPIVAQRSTALAGHETAPELEERLARTAADLLAASLPDWLAGRLTARPQPETGATLTRPLQRADGRLDPARSAVELERQVRALQPWPGSFIDLHGERLIVWRASPVPDATPGDVGALVPLEDTLALQTSDGRLRLDEVQPAGRRRMSGADFRRGRRA